MAFRLLALDIDGTIRTPNRAPSPRTRSAIASVENAGTIVTLATGRMSRSAQTVAKGLSLKNPIISSQGATIIDPGTGESLWHRPLTPKMASNAIETMSSWPSEILLYLRDEVYTTMNTPWVQAYGERNLGNLHIITDLNEVVDKPPTRLVAVGDEHHIQQLNHKLTQRFNSHLHVTRSLPYFCEILHPQAGKKNALRWLCHHLSVPRKETIVFGNGYNDVEMVSWAGLGVAVTGSPPELLEVADMLAPTVEEDGAAIVLESLLEQNAFR